MMRFLAKSYIITVILGLLASTACNRTPTYQWRVVEAPDKAFSVALPGDAVREDIPTHSDGGGSFISHNLKVRLPNKGFAISWWEDPSFKGQTPEQILDTIRDRGLTPIRGQLISQQRLTVHGYPAMDVSAIADGHAAYDNRMVVAGNRLYTLMVIDGNGRHDTQNIERFFDSLALN